MRDRDSSFLRTPLRVSITLSPDTIREFCRVLEVHYHPEEAREIIEDLEDSIEKVEGARPDLLGMLQTPTPRPPAADPSPMTPGENHEMFRV